MLDNLQDLNVTDVFYKGKLVDRNAPIRVKTCGRALKHTVHLDKVKAEQFVLPIGKKKTHVIGINPSQITTEDLAVSLQPAANYVPTDGYSKVAAVERHHNTGKIGVAVAKGYGIRNGAVASSVSHDSHNIIVIGDNDRDMALAVDEIIRTQGGYTVVENGEVFETLPLPIMGLMSDAGFESVNETLGRMIKKAHEMGVPGGYRAVHHIIVFGTSRHSDAAHYAARSVPADREGTGNSAGVKPVLESACKKSFYGGNLW